ncbi:16392_t:CDS:1, partial [Acaulospora morrowiae]
IYTHGINNWKNKSSLFEKIESKPNIVDRLKVNFLKDLFESFVRDTTVKFDIPKDIKEYLHDLLDGDIE